jgi:hypothetical protein
MDLYCLSVFMILAMEQGHAVQAAVEHQRQGSCSTAAFVQQDPGTGRVRFNGELGVARGKLAVPSFQGSSVWYLAVADAKAALGPTLDTGTIYFLGGVQVAVQSFSRCSMSSKAFEGGYELRQHRGVGADGIG